MNLSSSVYDYDVINDSWFLILKMNGHLETCFHRFHVLEKQKLIKTNRQTDQVTWVDLRHVKVESYEKQQLKLKYHLLRRKYYILEKVLHFRISTRQFIRVNEKEKTSSCCVPQSSILEPLLFLLYVNDLTNASNILDPIMFVDDTNLFFAHKDIRYLFQIEN